MTVVFDAARVLRDPHDPAPIPGVHAALQTVFSVLYEKIPRQDHHVITAWIHTLDGCHLDRQHVVLREIFTVLSTAHSSMPLDALHALQDDDERGRLAARAILAGDVPASLVEAMLDQGVMMARVHAMKRVGDWVAFSILGALLAFYAYAPIASLTGWPMTNWYNFALVAPIMVAGAGLVTGSFWLASRWRDCRVEWMYHRLRRLRRVEATNGFDAISVLADLTGHGPVPGVIPELRELLHACQRRSRIRDAATETLDVTTPLQQWIWYLHGATTAEQERVVKIATAELQGLPRDVDIDAVDIAAPPALLLRGESVTGELVCRMMIRNTSRATKRRHLLHLYWKPVLRGPVLALALMAPVLVVTGALFDALVTIILAAMLYRFARSDPDLGLASPLVQKPLEALGVRDATPGAPTA